MMETLKVKIQFKENGEGLISYNNKVAACLGQKGRNYPKDITINSTDKKLKHWSVENEVWMYYAILIWGQKGIYIHEGSDTINKNGGDSAGCIHVEKPHIKNIYEWITKRTRIIIEYPWEVLV